MVGFREVGGAGEVCECPGVDVGFESRAVCSELCWLS